MARSLHAPFPQAGPRTVPAARHHGARRALAALLLAGGLLTALPPAQAGPLVRRAQERRACQDFAAKLQQAGGNPAAAQQVYQQGVVALVQQFGENPCTDIPAPAAAGTPSPAPGTPATPATPGAAGAATTPAASPTSTPAGNQQQQACQQFAAKVQNASATAGSVAARQTYARGLETLTGLYGANPCPAVKPPQ